MMDSNGNGGFRGVSKQRAELSSLRSKNVKTDSLYVTNTTDLNDVIVNSTLDVNGTLSALDGIVVGSAGNILKQIKTGSLAVNPGSIAANTKGSVNVTITGIQAGDQVLLTVPSGLNSGLLYVGNCITANNTLTIYLYNTTGGAIDDSSFNWNYSWLEFI